MDVSRPAANHVPGLRPLGRSASARFLVGRALLDQGRDEEALVALDHVLGQNPEFADAHFLRGVALSKLGRRAEAIRHLELAVRLRPDHTDAALALGRAQLDAGSPDAALKGVDRAARTGPEAAAAESLQLLRAQILERMERGDEAARGYERVLAANPRSAVAHFELGRLLLERGRVKDALRHLTTARFFRPAHMMTRILIGDALRPDADLESIIREYRQAAAVDRSSALPYERMGAVYAERSLVPEALGVFKIGTFIDHGNIACYLGLARVYVERGSCRQAIEVLHRALEIAPDLEEAKGLLERANAGLAEGRTS